MAGLEGWMENFCDDLRSERERRHISLESISQMTKVSPRYLRALEAGNFDELPGGVFRKGFLRNYLSAVGLEQEPWLERFEASLQAAGAAAQPADITEFVGNIGRNRGAELSEHDLRWVGVALMASTVFLLGWCVWHFAFQGRVILSAWVSPVPERVHLVPPRQLFR
jgi:cytoskeletal protein RodZ